VKEVASMSTRQIIYAATVVIAAAAWFAFAEHPTARNLRIALLDTLAL
jgi:hypothetical protein